MPPSRSASGRDETPIERPVVAKAAASYHQPVLQPRVGANARTGIEALSARELEILELTSSGSRNADVAARLGLTVHAVKFHLASVFRKLEVANRTEAAALYFSGLADRGNGGGQDGTAS
jgi:DNA-binding CsgD family transcriptional regulator